MLTSTNARRSWVAVGLATAALGTAMAPAVASVSMKFRDDLRDLAPATAGPFDAARAKLTLDTSKGTKATLIVHGVDPAVAGRTFGAHLHVGPCVAGNGAAALGHYNHSGTTPPVVNDDTEIWLDVTINDEGNARSVATVDWAPTAGARSVVIHANPTAPDGTAGPRLACLPVEWS